MSDVDDNAGKVVIVTGAGNGIGRALAIGLAEAGYRVMVADIDAAAAARTAALLPEALHMAVDVADAASIDVLFSRVLERWRGLDVVVNNAGIFPRGRVVDLDLETWRRTLDVNLTGTFLGCRAAGRVLAAQRRGGRIINLSSTAAFEPAVRQAHYAATKAAIVAFSRDFAMEMAPHRVTVNVLAPGLVNTAQPRQDEDVTEEQLMARAAAIPLGRLAEPEDLLPTVLFLCSEGAAYITGQTFHVNGGLWMP